MKYLDGILIAVPSANKQAFIDHSHIVDEIFIEKGALRVIESWSDDVPKGKVTDFYGAVQAKEDESIVFSWIEWPDKATRDSAMEYMMAMEDSRLKENPMPFDGMRMIFGGFEPVVELAPKSQPQADENLEISINRFIDAPPEKVWQVITEQLTEWWCPKPWRAEIDAVEWRAGGRFDTTMYGPEGEVFPNQGIFLEVTPNKRLVTTDAVNGSWQPREAFMIGIIEISPENSGTRYTASARHWNAAARQKHLEMGFTEGWSIAADQLAEIAEADNQEG